MANSAELIPTKDQIHRKIKASPGEDPVILLLAAMSAGEEIQPTIRKVLAQPAADPGPVRKSFATSHVAATSVLTLQLIAAFAKPGGRKKLALSLAAGLVSTAIASGPMHASLDDYKILGKTSTGFRAHHIDTNGYENHSVIELLTILGTKAATPMMLLAHPKVNMNIKATVGTFIGLLPLNNIAHTYSHSPHKIPKLFKPIIKAAQKSEIFVSPESHARHHTSEDGDGYWSVLTGLTDPISDPIYKTVTELGFRTIGLMPARYVISPEKLDRAQLSKICNDPQLIEILFKVPSKKYRLKLLQAIKDHDLKINNAPNIEVDDNSYKTFLRGLVLESVTNPRRIRRLLSEQGMGPNLVRELENIDIDSKDIARTYGFKITNKAGIGLFEIIELAETIDITPHLDLESKLDKAG